MYVFDIESDGLLDQITVVKCINLIDRSDGREYRFSDYEFYEDLAGRPTDVPTKRNGTIRDALDLLAESDCIAAHNAIGYDIPAIQIVYPDWKPKGVVRDSAVISRLRYTNIKDRDFAALRKGKLPEEFQKKRLIGTHKLAAWGYRIGKHLKDDFDPKNYVNPETGEKHTWKTMPFTEEFDDYCMEDVRVNVDIFEFFETKDYSLQAENIEHRIAEILQKQEMHGWCFDEQGAMDLTAKLQKRKLELTEKLQAAFPPWEAFKDRFTPKRDNKKLGYIKGKTITRYKTVTFNPGSRDQIADRLMTLRGWQPLEKTSSGKVKVDETILAALPYPEAKLCAEYLTVDKRLGQIAEGKHAWLNHVKDGRIHGRVNHNGAVTGRMTHSHPNVAQTPANRAAYGKECRSLWRASPGKVLVGCDADGLELRCLAHFLAKYDGGEYIKVILEGNKDEGTDMHSRNQLAVGLRLRDNAKTMFYAWVYGAGDYKLGTVYVEDMSDEKRDRFYDRFSAGQKRKSAIVRLGRRSRERLVASIPGMESLLDAVGKAARRGYLRGLDGRELHVRSAHAALNTLLQSAGAIIMKVAAIKTFDTVGEMMDFVGNIHDEFQMETDPESGETVGRIAADSIAAAGEHFAFRCPLEGNFDVGTTWAETH